MKKRTIYIGLSLIFIIGIVSLIGTFAIDSTITEGNSSAADYLFNIVLGDRTNRQIVIPSYDSKIVDIKVSNPNTFNMSYLLYLEGTNSNISVVNIGDMDANGVVKSKDVETVRIFIQNNGSSNITVSLKDLVGFESETLSLPSNSTSINKSDYYKIVVTSNDSAYGKVKPNIKLSATNGVVKYTLTPIEGYQYKSTTCEGTVVDNILTISNITSNVNCEVVFEPSTITISYDATGGNYGTTTYTEAQEHTYKAPYNGTYKIELWGAQGGGTSTYPGGYGGYVKGNIQLNKDETLYFYVGENYNGYKNSINFNGGGRGTVGTSGSKNYNGGGATDVRYFGTYTPTETELAWDATIGLNSRIMVASGGGGFTDWNNTRGGNGGGLTGYSGNKNVGSIVNAAGGTQTDGGLATNNTSTSPRKGDFGIGGYNATYAYEWAYEAGGGGGYYGGGSGGAISGSVGSGAGGSSYISGHTGSVAITSSSDRTPRNDSSNSACTTGTSDNLCSIHYSNKKFTDTVMIDGSGYSWTNTKGSLQQMPTIDGGLYESGIGNSGNGSAKITMISASSYQAYYGGNYETLPTPSRKNYDFVGWYTEPDGKGTLITEGSKILNTKDHTLYAKWEKKCNLPTFTYTGTYEIVDDDNNAITNTTTYMGNWKIRFLSSGTLTISDLGSASDGIDVFVVGGGGNGARGTSYTGNSAGGGGGGGGSAITVTRIAISTGTSYSIVVGAATKNSSFGVESTAYFTALAGSTAPAATFSNTAGFSATAGVGGAGRLSTETNNYGAIGVTVKNGSTGNGIAGNYEFNEEGNKRYGAGGGFGTQGVSTSLGGTAALGKDGGADGGGKGGQGCSYDTRNGKYAIYGAYAGSSGTANTGSGGGGGGGACGTGTSTSGSTGGAGAGGSGIVIIRNTRTNETNPPVGTLTATKSYNTINASISATDDTGIDHYEYYLSASSTCPTTGYTTSNSNTHSFEVTNTGTYYVCARVVDLSGNVLSLKSNAFTVSRVYKVAIRYNTNGGTITSSAGGYTWTTDSTGLIYRNGSVYEQTIYYGETADLADYNNSNYINIDPGELFVPEDEEWICLSGCSTADKIFSQKTKYNATDFCDVTSANCTVVVGLRLVSDTTQPTCSLSASGTTITATYSDEGGSGIAYYGWSSSYSGSNSSTGTITEAKTYTFYVKDGAGNTNTCSGTVVNTTSSPYEDCGSYLQDSGGCYYYTSASSHLTGSYYCKQTSTGSVTQYSCANSGGANCPSGYTLSSNNCSYAYSCSSGYLVNKSCKIYTSGTTVTTYSCAGGYTKLNDSYCWQ